MRSGSEGRRVEINEKVLNHRYLRDEVAEHSTGRYYTGTQG